MIWTERAQFLVDNLYLPGATGVDDARWEHFQIAHLNNDATFGIENKSRQIAWSWIIAAEAVAEAVLAEQSSIFVSINLDEAKEKIRYAKAVFENLQIGGLPHVDIDNQLELEFDNGARIISHASKPPRGKARFNVYLDEFAHVQHDRQIMTGAMPIISKGGRLRIGSSPLGASGTFWEIYSQSLRQYPGFTRKRTPWWEVQAFCTNVPEAAKLAPAMATAVRVERYGNERIQAIFANVLLEDFQQEYEASFVDETTAWITWEEIRKNQSSELTCLMAEMRGSDISRVFDAIESTARYSRTGHIERALSVGVDIGRTRNTTEIYAVGSSTTGSYPLRLALSLDNVEFDDQLEVLTKVMTVLPVSKMLIDRNGIGRNLAENMEKKFPSKAEGVDFTNETKKLWATDTKMLFQQGKVPIPPDRDLAYQIHSIKKRVSESKNLIFDTDRNEKHHADRFWALALALSSVQHKRSATKQRNWMNN